MRHRRFTFRKQNISIVHRLIAVFSIQVLLICQFAWAGDNVFLNNNPAQFDTLSPRLSIGFSYFQNRFFTLSNPAVRKNILIGRNVLITSFRIVFGEQLGGKSALDGVSLEVKQWEAELKAMGAKVYFFAGEMEVPGAAGIEEMPLAHFRAEPLQTLLKEHVFKRGYLKKHERKIIDIAKERIKRRLKSYIRKNNIDLIISENGHSFPGNPALSRAITEVLTEISEERRIKLIKHSHDFYWERDRFTIVPGENLERDLKEMVKGKRENSATIAINSSQQNFLKKHFGIDADVAPNVRDFDNPPVIDQAKLEGFLKYFNIDKDKEYLILLPMRPLKRKNLELAFEMIEKMMIELAGIPKGKKVKVMLTHPNGDEGNGYWEELKAAVRGKGIDLIDAGDGKENPQAGEFDLATAYAACDIVFYPSKLEGYGNVVPEAMYYKKPFVIYPYPIYLQDIKPLGLKCIETKTASDAVIHEIIEFLQSPLKVKEMVEHNYEVGRKHLSRTVLRKILTSVIEKLYSGSEKENIKKTISPQGLNIESLRMKELIEQAI